MSRRTLEISDALYNYLQSVTVDEIPVLRQLRMETAKLAGSEMQISPEQGQFMSLLMRLLNASRVIEIGVFTGYSALCIAKELPSDGLLVACDVSEEWTNIARQYWARSGVADKIDLRLAPATDTTQRLLEEFGASSFDAAFIDADKSNYLIYYENCLELLRPGGLLMVDNTLWGGSVANPEKQDNDTNAIRHLNQFIAGDPRVRSSLLTIGDGLTLALKNQIL